VIEGQPDILSASHDDRIMDFTIESTCTNCSSFDLPPSSFCPSVKVAIEDISSSFQDHQSHPLIKVQVPVVESLKHQLF
jgi:hypothetical protein